MIGTNALANGVAIAAGDHDVEEHEVRRVLGDGGKRRLAVRDGAHAKAGLLQRDLPGTQAALKQASEAIRDALKP